MCSITGPNTIIGKADEATILAITLLFGNRFVEEADPQLLTALRDSPEAIGDLLTASWGQVQTA